jgi:hypothetical protein
LSGSSAGAAFYVAPAPNVAFSPIQMSQAIASEASRWSSGDYAWVHGALVEGFFVILTIVIVPVAVLRWMRRPNIRPHETTHRHHQVES